MKYILVRLSLILWTTFSTACDAMEFYSSEVSLSAMFMEHSVQTKKFSYLSPLLQFFLDWLWYRVWCVPSLIGKSYPSLHIPHPPLLILPGLAVIQGLMCPLPDRQELPLITHTSPSSSDSSWIGCDTGFDVSPPWSARVTPHYTYLTLLFWFFLDWLRYRVWCVPSHTPGVVWRLELLCCLHLGCLTQIFNLVINHLCISISNSLQLYTGKLWSMLKVYCICISFITIAL